MSRSGCYISAAETRTNDSHISFDGFIQGHRRLGWFWFTERTRTTPRNSSRSRAPSRRSWKRYRQTSLYDPLAAGDGKLNLLEVSEVPYGRS